MKRFGEGILRATAVSPVLVIALTVVSAEAPSYAQPQSEVQLRCIKAMDRSFERVARVQGKINKKCLLDRIGGRGEVVAVDDCLALDVTGKLGRVQKRTFRAEARSCDVAPDFGVVGADALNHAAVVSELRVIADLLGADADATVGASATDGGTARCMKKIVRSIERLARVERSLFLRCKRAGLRTGTIGSTAALEGCLDTVRDTDAALRARSRLVDAFARYCNVTGRGNPLEISEVFPGRCASAAAWPECVTALVDCHLCTAVGKLNGLVRNCELYDNGVADGSCWLASCGNDVLDERETCDGSADSACPGACLPDCSCPRPAAGEELPRLVIEPPAPIARVPLTPDPALLPAGARAHLPALDGDTVLVRVPPTVQAVVSADQVRATVIDPIVATLGVTVTLASPPPEGSPMPVADFAALASDLEAEVVSHPNLFGSDTEELIDAFLGLGPATPALNAALELATGMTVPEFAAELERLAFRYVFPQVVGTIPIEGRRLVASRRDGETVSTVVGRVLGNFRVVNAPVLADPAAAGIVALASVPGMVRVISAAPDEAPVLVLLPHGSDPDGTIQLRHAYRMTLTAESVRTRGRFTLWIDAETATVLMLAPPVEEVDAQVRAYRRDPSLGEEPVDVQVDPAVNGSYVLSLAPMTERIDVWGDGYDEHDVSIGESAGGSSSQFANFDQPPINDGSTGWCGMLAKRVGDLVFTREHDNPFAQAHVFAKLYQYRQTAVARGLSLPFPSEPWTTSVHPRRCQDDHWRACRSHADCAPGDLCGGLCDARVSGDDIWFGACPGYYSLSCPDQPGERLSYALDSTVIAHEVGHVLMDHLGTGYLGFYLFHDLADAWAADLASTNCVGGWVAKNRFGGPDGSLYCAEHDEFTTPRLHEVTLPFDPDDPGDHFPEHRDIAVDETGYADGQIPAAALWWVRLGMRSKSLLTGGLLYGIRFQRAMSVLEWNAFSSDERYRTCRGGPDAGQRCSGSSDCSGRLCHYSDTTIYHGLYDLERAMLTQWVNASGNGAQATNEVTAGFARAGMFFIPQACLDGDSATADARYCPLGEYGGDAVIDIEDNVAGDDFVIDAVPQPEDDYLRLPSAGGGPPTFHVWTGPRYRLNGAGGGDYTLDNPAPCNNRFQVSVSVPIAPGGPRVLKSGWQVVDTDPNTPKTPECYGTWTPTAAEWQVLAGDLAELTRVYYSAATENTNGTRTSESSQPGGGVFGTLPLPYAVLTVDGRRPPLTGIPQCGDGAVNQEGELCDGTDDEACPGNCLPDCTCAFCGNDVVESPVEDCDGGDLGTCPVGPCRSDCSCPTVVGCLIDPDDGTIIDSCTGYTWEKKDGDDGIPNPNNPHDVDNRYTWAGTCSIGNRLCQPDPSASLCRYYAGSVAACDECGVDEGTCEVAPEAEGTVWEFLGSVGSTQWRLPTSAGTLGFPSGEPAELESLLLEPFPCSTSPCVHDLVGPTIPFLYWSATPSSAGGAWTVNFDNGDVPNAGYLLPAYVRAMRDTE